MINRRGFFSMLSGLPLVGPLLVASAEAAVAVDVVSDMKDRILELESQPRIEWISVEDRLPDLDSDWKEWADGEPRELVTLGKISLPVLISAGVGDKHRSQVGYLTQYDGESPQWVAPCRNGTLWETCVTHWASLPKQFECYAPLRDRAWKRFSEDRVPIAKDKTPFEEKDFHWSICVKPIKSLPTGILGDVLFFGEEFGHRIARRDRPPSGATHWMYIPTVKP